MKTFVHNVVPARQFTVAQGGGVSDEALAALERQVAALQAQYDANFSPARITELVSLAIRPLMAELALQEKEMNTATVSNAKPDEFDGYDVNSLMEH